LATGPHLDFRLAENGAFINPFNLKNINTQGLNPQYRVTFEAMKREMMARLEGPEKRGILLAKNSPLLF
jgi:hypothetical protein